MPTPGEGYTTVVSYAVSLCYLTISLAITDREYTTPKSL
jgi:hypothetical protein